MIMDLVLANRSYRRFIQKESIDEKTLRALVDLARQTPSSANLQPLKYLLTCTPERNAEVFSTLSWAGYLTDWDGPADGERPSAYIVVLNDTSISPTINCDHGIAVQTMLLAAAELGLGGCIFGSIDRRKLREQFDIDEHLDILLVVALGKPLEKVVLEEVAEDGSIKYYRDAQAVHHVPKRALEDIILKK
ncbi:MAG: nitroreductase family protein [Armatimonadota bacterium]|jgi:nitroreductase